MHASYLLLSAASLALSQGYLYSVHAAAQRPSWRTLISRGPADLHAPRMDQLTRCGAAVPGAREPSDAIKYAVLDKDDLAHAQTRLMRYCETGGRIAPSGATAGHVETSGDVSVQLCNLSSRPIPCDRDDIQAMFESITCGSRDAPQMGFAAPTPDGPGGIHIFEADYFLALGPTAGLIPQCRPKTEL